ncbi:MAG: hypothetical protein EAZ25_07140 [Oscillatoriales cyanobacterium]|nr:MAG: hypothetical protein EAZ25_07140 [Oscillatoriales cyanobacterium]TAG73765.1 MAG: hypothetical protein EAZ23_09080 [Oscillatoriales cyanobacterium]
MQAAGVQRILRKRLVRPLSERPYPLQCLLFAYLSGSAIFMQNFCIIYKTLHNSRISGPRGGRWCARNQALRAVGAIANVWGLCGML